MEYFYKGYEILSIKYFEEPIPQLPTFYDG